MNGRVTALATMLLAASFSAPAAAEFVFFDDFDGDALLPHWSVPSPSAWEYNVSNSMLNVMGLFSPSSPKSPSNFAAMGASFDAQTDFQLDTTMGWGTSEGVARLELLVRINSGIVAWMGYREHDTGGPPGIYAAAFGGGMVTIPSPPPGMYDFRIVRNGSIFNFYFEGELFASLTSAYAGPVNGLSFFFSSPYPGQTGPFHIDSVQVIPTPGTLVVVAGLMICASRRKRLAGVLKGGRKWLRH